jgi:hypothetical protein
VRDLLYNNTNACGMIVTVRLFVVFLFLFLLIIFSFPCVVLLCVSFLLSCRTLFGSASEPKMDAKHLAATQAVSPTN